MIVYQWFGWNWTPIAIPFPALTFTVAGALHRGLPRPFCGLPWTSAGEASAPCRAAGLGSSRCRHSAHGLVRLRCRRWTWYYLDARLAVDAVVGCPVFEPPSSAWGTAWTGSLWFVPAYLWLALISPPLLWCFRKWPLRTAAFPALGLALALSGIWSPSSLLGEVLLTFALFGGYWLIGFAYHDNRIQKMSWTLVILFR